jgi:hypothetical protein
LDKFDHIELICELLERFRVLNSSDIEAVANITADHLVVNWGFVPAAHRIVAVSDLAESDGSHHFLLALRTALMKRGSWKEANFVSDIGSAVAHAKPGQTILLLDDFIGTGTKIERKLKWFKQATEAIGSLKIYVAAVAAMERSQEKLASLQHPYYVPIWLKRAISDYEPLADVPKKISQMLEIEGGLMRRCNGRFLTQFSLGFGKAEAAFWIQPMNVPNNVFPVFWWRQTRGKRHRNTIFVAS